MGISASVLTIDDTAPSADKFGARLNSAELFIAWLVPDVGLYSLVGYLIGQRKRVVLVSGPDDRIPAIMSHVPIVAKDDSNVCRVLAEHVRRDPESSVERLALPTTQHELFQWLHEAPDRVALLDTVGLEKIMRLLLARVGLAQTSRATHSLSDDVFYDKVSNTKVFVQYKTTPIGRALDIGLLRQVVGDCAALGCDFAFVATNARLTEAAKAYALSCVPPLWPVGYEFFRGMATDGDLPLSAHVFLDSASDDSMPTVSYDSLISSVAAKLVTGMRQDDAEKSRRQETPIGKRVFFYVPSASLSDASTYRMGITRLFGSLRDHGVHVGHNCDISHLDIGTSHPTTDEMAAALRESSLVVIFEGPNRPRNHAQMSELLWFVRAYERAVEHDVPVLAVCESARLSRFRFPAKLSISRLIERTSEDWHRDVLDSCLRNLG